MQKTARFTKTLLLLLVLGVWGLLVRPFVPMSPVEAQAKTVPRAKWEYLISASNKSADFNALGKQGWELVAVGAVGGRKFSSAASIDISPAAELKTLPNSIRAAFCFLRREHAYLFAISLTVTPLRCCSPLVLPIHPSLWAKNARWL